MVPDVQTLCLIRSYDANLFSFYSSFKSPASFSTIDASLRFKKDVPVERLLPYLMTRKNMGASSLAKNINILSSLCSAVTLFWSNFRRTCWRESRQQIRYWTSRRIGLTPIAINRSKREWRRPAFAAVLLITTGGRQWSPPCISCLHPVPLEWELACLPACPNKKPAERRLDFHGH